MRKRIGLWVVLLLALVLVAGCGSEKDEAASDTTAATDTGGGGGGGTADCGKVVLNEQAWAGSTANTYIAKNVLENKLGCTVEITKITEIPVFQAMADGKVDAVLEDWQHVDQYKQYIDEAGTVVQGGPLGVEGHIGWFIPKYTMDDNPEFKTWEGLKGKESIFKTAESGSQGMFLGGDPSYVQKDKELIEALGLDFKHVTAGAEPAQVARWTQLYKQKKPVIFYWYTPQYLNQEYELAEVELPERTANCKDDAKSGGDVNQYKCAYDVTIINKLFSKKFADSGSPAYDMLSKFKLTNEDQEAVAKMIAGDKMDPEEAAQKWVDENQDKVEPLGGARLTPSLPRCVTTSASRSCSGRRRGCGCARRGSGRCGGRSAGAWRGGSASSGSTGSTRTARTSRRTTASGPAWTRSAASRSRASGATAPSSRRCATPCSPRSARP
jgi:glycine betaine/proline transport system substrate-binding protein